MRAQVAELFAFEVPTSMGKFRIIGPDSLTADEAALVAAKIARLLPLMVLEPEAEPVPLWDEDHPHDHRTHRHSDLDSTVLQGHLAYWHAEPT